MTDPVLERDIYFFMAYLARRGSDLSFEIPLDRDAYQFIEGSTGKATLPILRTFIGLADDIAVPLQCFFDGPFDPEDLDRKAEELIEELTDIDDALDVLVDEVRELRSHAEEVFKETRSSKLKFVSLELDMRTYQPHRHQYILTYEKLGADAKPVTQTAYVADVDDIDGELGRQKDEQKGLASRAREYAKGKADGAIDPVLLSRLERHSIDPFSIIKFDSELRDHDIVETPDGELRLFWKDGVLTAHFTLVPGIEWHGGLINFDAFPANGDGKLAGRKVSDFIKLPDVPDDLTFISGVAKAGERGAFHAELNYYLFDSEKQLIF